MSQAKDPYPPDEFDVVDPTAPRSPHRAPKTRAQRFLPFLAAIVLGPLLAYLIVTAAESGGLTGVEATSTQGPGETVTPTADPNMGDEDATTTPPEPSDEATTDETEEAQETEEPPPAPDPDLGTRVMVLNATNTSGLAGRARSTLEDAGWSNVATGNYSGTLAGSVVFYAEDDDVLESSARAVAEELGIDDVELDPDAATDPITVVLESDFTP